ncbi:helix-turn-helix domain-containing protein [Octadecabacter sp. R77987]|uniref:helix-turn-helix domain-containing protein n=1 Tax=Octadecabacter sp. R77987 TaxID=3093874 RepID=UPI00366F91DA
MKKADTAYTTTVRYRDILLSKIDALTKGAIEHPRPVWEYLTTKELSERLSISMQTLGNWRVRNQGPRFRTVRKGTKCLYRLDEVFEWLTGQPNLKFCHQWLVHRGLADSIFDEEYVNWATGIMHKPQTRSNSAI